MSRPKRRITEEKNPRTGALDQLPPRAILELILDEDSVVPDAVRAQLEAMAEAVGVLTLALERGGRWLNLGAGTSGRIGMLDAAEIPPTFGLDPGRVLAVIAGGERALTQAVEGVEDDTAAARCDLQTLGFGEGDVLVALSASGRTPYVVAAVEYASEQGATSIGITCAPDSALAHACDIPIAVFVGPEAIAGSTRMKGGLAQKMVLHALSTAVMVRLGRVRGNLMTGLTPVNAKLRERALSILCDLAGCTPARARTALDEAEGSIEEALRSLGSQG